jgi:transposase-like protein
MSAGSRYSDEQRREAVAHYVLLGNWRRVAEATGIPQRTLHDWSTQPWFGTLLAEVRAEKAVELDGVYTRIIDKATTELLDRLERGDPYIVGGEVKRKPVSARDLALVAAITFDKRQASRDLPAPTRPIGMDEFWARLEERGQRMREAIEGRRLLGENRSLDSD